ncbi:phosphoenolpyruvate carboxylase, partial [Salmonella enterica]|uniref:phosphoenolpyruvate carboxylase n=1 Tax=Salmonella enterica TaxID=28901 RepID=UPI001D0C4009
QASRFGQLLAFQTRFQPGLGRHQTGAQFFHQVAIRLRRAFFATRLGMLEMVFSKADLWLADYYDQRLVAKTLWPLGKELRDLLEEDIKVVLAIANDSHLMADLPWIAESIQLRNVYTDPLNVLQAELLYRSRLTEEQGKSPDPRVEQALMVTIAGVAAGMRNTG